jgi:hypothetical protein
MQDSESAAIDVSAASTITFYLVKPDNTVATRTGTFYTDGTDGKVQYVTISGDLDQIGLWSVYVYVVVSGQELTSDETSFFVYASTQWEIELVEMLRIFINDLSDTPTYSNDRLRRVLVTAAHIVAKDGMNFSYDFAVDISKQSISPDPVADATKDSNFINLVAAKAACMITSGEMRDAIKQGVSVRDGSFSVDLKGKASGYLEMAKTDWCALYTQMKEQYQMGLVGDIGAAITGPFRIAPNPILIARRQQYY